MGSVVAQTVKTLPAMQETQVQSLGQEDPLEEGMATHSSIVEEELDGTTIHGVAKSGTLLHSWTTMYAQRVQSKNVEQRWIRGLGLTYTHYWSQVLGSENSFVP